MVIDGRPEDGYNMCERLREITRECESVLLCQYLPCSMYYHMTATKNRTAVYMDYKRRKRFGVFPITGSDDIFPLVFGYTRLLTDYVLHTGTVIVKGRYNHVIHRSHLQCTASGGLSNIHCFDHALLS